MASVFRFRPVREVLDSTYATLRKLAGLERLADTTHRAEPLVVAGPYRYVRHPLYSGILALALGMALVSDRTFALLGALALYPWFSLVLMPFEERELKALFGPGYEAYMRRTPRIVPLPRRGAGRL